MKGTQPGGKPKGLKDGADVKRRNKKGTGREAMRDVRNVHFFALY